MCIFEYTRHILLYARVCFEQQAKHERGATKNRELQDMEEKSGTLPVAPEEYLSEGIQANHIKSIYTVYIILYESVLLGPPMITCNSQ